MQRPKGALKEGGTVPPEAPIEAPKKPEPIGPNTMVIFSFVRADGTTGEQRTFLMGVPAIRTQAQVATIEQLLLNESKKTGIPYIAVMLRDWKSLEG